jgi:leucyl-tRNA synthetase
MSKARGNVVNPDDVVKGYGADALRGYEMFMGPLEQVKPWQTSGIEGVHRFLERVWNVATGPLSVAPAAYDDETKRLVHKTVRKVTLDIEGLRFNTALSAMMILVRHLVGLAQIPREAVETLALMVGPFAPHLGEELWQRLGHVESQAYATWPQFDPDLVHDRAVEIGVQVNGKVRGAITLAVDADVEVAKAAALADPRIASHLQGKKVRNVIYVKSKILNFILG